MEKSIIYQEEEPQIEQVKKLSSVNYLEMYGAEHLLRAVCRKTAFMLWVDMIPILYSSADISERESELIHEVILSLYQFLLRHPQYFCSFDEYTSLEESTKNLVWIVICFMETPFVSAEIYRGRAYPKQTPGHTKKCISVNSEGFVTLIDTYTWFVLNPYTNTVYSFPGSFSTAEEEDENSNSKKRVWITELL